MKAVDDEGRVLSKRQGKVDLSDQPVAMMDVSQWCLETFICVKVEAMDIIERRKG